MRPLGVSPSKLTRLSGRLESSSSPRDAGRELLSALRSRGSLHAPPVSPSPAEDSPLESPSLEPAMCPPAVLRCTSLSSTSLSSSETSTSAGPATPAPPRMPEAAHFRLASPWALSIFSPILRLRSRYLDALPLTSRYRP